MALPAILAGKITKAGVGSVLKVIGYVVVAWLIYSAISGYVADQKQLREAIVEQSVGRVQAETKARSLQDAQVQMERTARETEAALKAARESQKVTETEFAKYRSDQRALLKSLNSADFETKAQTQPVKAASEANALMSNLNAQMEGVFDGS